MKDILEVPISITTPHLNIFLETATKWIMSNTCPNMYREGKRRNFVFFGYRGKEGWQRILIPYQTLLRKDLVNTKQTNHLNPWCTTPKPLIFYSRSKCDLLRFIQGELLKQTIALLVDWQTQSGWKLEKCKACFLHYSSMSTNAGSAPLQAVAVQVTYSSGKNTCLYSQTRQTARSWCEQCPAQHKISWASFTLPNVLSKFDSVELYWTRAMPHMAVAVPELY